MAHETTGDGQSSLTAQGSASPFKILAALKLGSTQASIMIMLLVGSPSVGFAADNPEVEGGSDWRIIGALIGAAAGLLGVFVNGVFNYLNWRRSGQSLRRSSELDLARHTFRDQTGGPINAILQKFAFVARRLQAAVSGAPDPAIRKNRVKAVQDDCMGDYLDLCVLLRLASSNSDVHGNDWIETAEVDWDAFLQALDTILNEDNPLPRVNAAISNAEGALGRISMNIAAKVKDAERHIIQRSCGN